MSVVTPNPHHPVPSRHIIVFTHPISPSPPSSLPQTEQEFESERQEIVATHVRQKKDLQDIIVAMEAEFARIAAEAEQEFEAERTGEMG